MLAYCKFRGIGMIPWPPPWEQPEATSCARLARICPSQIFHGFHIGENTLGGGQDYHQAGGSARGQKGVKIALTSVDKRL